MQISLVSPPKVRRYRRDSLFALILSDFVSVESRIPAALADAGLASVLNNVLPLLAREKAPELFPFIAPDGLPTHLAIFVPSRIENIPVDEAQRLIGARLVKYARDLGLQFVYVWAAHGISRDVLLRVAEGAILGGYSFARYKRTVEQLRLNVSLLCEEADHGALQKRLTDALVVAEQQNRIRDLVNEAPSDCGPLRLVDVARRIARTVGLDVEILGPRQLERSGYAGVLAVGKGADEPPAMIILRHAGAGKKSVPRLAFVGKAVTFDAGGYCLKPGKDMWEMKGDMAGGAVVLGALAALARLGVGQEVIGIIPCAKNLVSRSAYLPGDVIRTKIGKTVHVTNTDAEGRLLLADALIRAGEEKASVIVDVATLTGSVVRALGTAVAGVMGNDNQLVRSIISSGEAVGEAFWELPLVAEYKDQLKSDVADLDNVGKTPNAGAIVGGLFLQEFVPERTKWAHLDIAGPFLVEKPWRYYGPGATGFGVRTLVQFAALHAREFMQA